MAGGILTAPQEERREYITKTMPIKKLVSTLQEYAIESISRIPHEKQTFCLLHIIRCLISFNFWNVNFRQFALIVQV